MQSVMILWITVHRYSRAVQCNLGGNTTSNLTDKDHMRCNQVFFGPIIYECKVAALLHWAALLDCSPCHKCFTVDVVYLATGGEDCLT